METETMSMERESVIELTDVTVSVGERYEIGLDEVTLLLSKGEAAIVVVPRTGLSTPLADLCCGLEGPETGTVRFLGQSWDERNNDQVVRDRGHIGRIWPEPAWVGNLDIDENILLSQQHHTRRSETELREEALTLARTFGLDDLPHTRPAWTPEAIRRKAQWVRALMGTPALLLLDYPDDAVSEIDHTHLVEAVERARTRGTAVIWITARRDLDLTDQSGAVHQTELTGPHLTWRPEENTILETTKEKTRE
jgi:phospholipid/cholesterol/gamma-HCH transport system ATP-binding protein